MILRNTTERSYYLVFQKILEFKKFCGVALSRDEAIKLKRMLQKEKPGEKFLIVKLKSREEKGL
jgi:hypothetical protein